MFTELHFHTKETSRCADVSAYDSVPMYMENGYDAIVTTDHFSRSYFEDYYAGKISYEDAIEKWLAGYRAAKDAGDKCGVKVFLGCEIAFDRYPPNDYLVYGLTEEILLKYKCPWEWSEREFFYFANRHHIFFAQAHPFRNRNLPCETFSLHGIEVFNASRTQNSNNHMSIMRWLETELKPICGSDFHHEDALLGCGVRFFNKAENSDDLVRMLFDGEYDLIIPAKYRYKN